MNTDKINNLITRLLDDSLAPGEILPEGIKYDSTKTVSFIARAEMETLEKVYINDVIQILEKEKNTARKSEAFNILCKLAINNNDYQSLYYILEKLSVEKNKGIVQRHLGNLSWKTMELTEKLDIVLAFAKRKEWQIRHSAIQLLAFYIDKKGEIEDFLIEILSSNNEEYDLLYTIQSLAKMGTIKSIAPLKEVLKSNTKTNILMAGIIALGNIDGKNQVDFFIELMDEKKDSFVKSSLTEQIAARAVDSRAVDVLIERTKQILANPRKTNMGYWADFKPEIVHAAIYLLKYEHDKPDITKLLNWVLEKKFDFLDETERTWFEKNIRDR